MNNIKEKLEKLASDISRAGRVIAKDSINKYYTVAHDGDEGIEVTSDSGFESICIGNVVSKDSRGYMYLYSNNASERNSFPNEKEIAELLEKILNKEKLETGEGKASYFDWKEFGGLDKQLEYFSELVKKFAKIK